MDKLGQILQGILNYQALSFTLGTSGNLVSSSPDDLYTIQIQDHKATCSIPSLGPTIKLLMHNLA